MDPLGNNKLRRGGKSRLEEVDARVADLETERMKVVVRGV